MPTNRKNTSRRSASAGTPTASPPGTRSRVAEAARRTNNPEYAGLTIEATRHWSRLMVRPVTLL